MGDAERAARQASGLSEDAAMALSNRRIVGFVTTIVGVIISIGHLIFGLFDRVPEKYHSHLAIVATGFGLTIIGLLFLAKAR